MYRSHDLDQAKARKAFFEALSRGQLMNEAVDARDRMAVVPLRGEVCGPTAHLVYAQTSSLISAYAPRHLTLDLRAVTRIDETGLGELARIHTFAGQHDCVCELAAVPSDVQQLLVDAGQDDTFRAAASADSA